MPASVLPLPCVSAFCLGLDWHMLTLPWTFGCATTAATLLISPTPCPCRRTTLDWTFGYHHGSNPSFIWQWIGSSLFFLFPAITYTLQVGVHACCVVLRCAALCCAVLAGGWEGGGA